MKNKDNQWLDEIFLKLDKSIVSGITFSIVRDEVFDTDPILLKAKQAILAHIDTLTQEVYKDGYIKGGIDAINRPYRGEV